MILRVMSSSVGPRPPVVITTFERRTASLIASSRRASSSPTIVLSFTSMPRRVEFFGEPETVGISAVGREQFRTDRDDFGCQRFKQL